MVVDCADGGTIIARGFVGPARWLRSDVSLKHAYNTAKEAPGSHVGVPDDFSSIPMELLTFERHGVAATYKATEHAMAGAGERAQRITDLPNQGHGREGHGRRRDHHPRPGGKVCRRLSSAQEKGARHGGNERSLF
ncbi:MAG: hypothetical protein ACLTG4_03230 [Oscillospiraceae bacterium]